MDKRRVPLVHRDAEKDIDAGVVYSVVLKREVLVAFVYYKDEKTGGYKKNNKGRVKPEIILFTDIAMKPLEMCRYYGLRFQVEFLIRDAKSYCGLEHSKARSKEKLYTHFNAALTAVSIAKAAYHLLLPKKKRESFSMMDIKMQHMDELLTNRIFSNLAIDRVAKNTNKLMKTVSTSADSALKKYRSIEFEKFTLNFLPELKAPLKFRQSFDKKELITLKDIESLL